MKTEDLARPGVLALGVVGMAAMALLGLAAGVAVTRDPAILRRTVRRVARGLESATLMAAQAREQVGDLWAQAREEAIAEVDAADFERAAARSAKTTRATVASAAASPVKTPRRRASGTRKTRKSTAAANEAAAKQD
jgi:hypothetical protein